MADIKACFKPVVKHASLPSGNTAQMATIGDRISNRLDELDGAVTVKDIAAACKVRVQSVYQWISGATKDLKSENLLNTARVLGVEVQWLTNGTGRKERANESYAISTSVNLSIDLMNATASAGPGNTRPDGEFVIGTMQVPMDWVRRNIECTSFSNLRTLRSKGDSMFPTFSDGDIVVIDIGVRRIDTDEVYVVSLDNELYIKRFERRPFDGNGVLWMISDNKAKHEKPHVIDQRHAGTFEVLGRCVWVWNGRKL